MLARADATRIGRQPCVHDRAVADHEAGGEAAASLERAVDAASASVRTYGSVARVNASVAVRATSAGMLGTV